MNPALTVEQGELLLPVPRVVGRIETQGNRRRRAGPLPAANGVNDQHLLHALEVLDANRPVLEPRQRRLSRQRRAVRPAPVRLLELRVGSSCSSTKSRQCSYPCAMAKAGPAADEFFDRVGHESRVPGAA
jgi:hypothetical protein